MKAKSSIALKPYLNFIDMCCEVKIWI